MVISFDNKVDDAVAKSYESRIIKVSKNSETVTNEHDKEIPNERYIFPEKKKINYWWTYWWD